MGLLSVVGSLTSTVRSAVATGAGALGNGVVTALTKVTGKATEIGNVLSTVAVMTAREVHDPMAMTETQEVIDAAIAMLAVAKRVGSDGWQITDAGLIITDRTLMDTIAKAINGADKIPQEMSKLSLTETLGLAMTAVSALQKLGK